MDPTDGYGLPCNCTTKTDFPTDNMLSDVEAPKSICRNDIRCASLPNPIFMNKREAIIFVTEPALLLALV